MKCRWILAQRWFSEIYLAQFGTVRGGIGQMEQQFCWEVLYNLYVLHVGA